MKQECGATRIMPSAGDLVIVEHPHAYDRHVIAKVISTGKVMWVVQYRDRFSEDGWTSDRRRKVIDWLPAPSNMTPMEIDDFLRQAADELRVSERAARDDYRRKIDTFAKGADARQQEQEG